MTVERDKRQPPLRLPQRVPVDLPVHFAVAGGAARVGRVVNLTRGGLFIATPTPAGVGTVVGLTFTLPPTAGVQRLEAAAEVRWVNEGEPPQAATLPPGMGLRFVGLAPDGWALLRVVLAERLAALMRAAGHPVAMRVPPLPRT
jgi:uncharacterized protein (TIGR02266 family)